MSRTGKPRCAKSSTIASVPSVEPEVDDDDLGEAAKALQAFADAGRLVEADQRGAGGEHGRRPGIGEMVGTSGGIGESHECRIGRRSSAGAAV